jgi:hypothetical protein
MAEFQHRSKPSFNLNVDTPQRSLAKLQSELRPEALWSSYTLIIQHGESVTEDVQIIALVASRQISIIEGVFENPVYR